MEWNLHCFIIVGLQCFALVPSEWFVCGVIATLLLLRGFGGIEFIQGYDVHEDEDDARSNKSVCFRDHRWFCEGYHVSDDG